MTRLFHVNRHNDFRQMYWLQRLIPLLALLLWAAAEDLWRRRIANWLSFSLILSGLLQTLLPGHLISPTQALAGLPAWNGRIVIDANNPIEAPLFKPADLNGRLSSEIFADLVPGARVVKAFNHLQPHLVSGDPKAEGGRRVLFFSGDDAAAKGEVARLIDRLGFFGIDLGPLSVGGRLVQFPGGPLPALNLVRFE